MEKCIQKFEAVGGNEQKYILEVYQEFVDAGTRGDPHATIPGMKRICTQDGLEICRIAKGEYGIVQTDEVLRSSAPDAP